MSEKAREREKAREQETIKASKRERELLRAFAMARAARDRKQDQERARALRALRASAAKERQAWQKRDRKRRAKALASAKITLSIREQARALERLERELSERLESMSESARAVAFRACERKLKSARGECESGRLFKVLSIAASARLSALLYERESGLFMLSARARELARASAYNHLFESES